MRRRRGLAGVARTCPAVILMELARPGPDTAQRRRAIQASFFAELP